MVKPVLIAITGTQQLAGEKPESIQLVTEGSYCCEPGFIRFSYVESEMTGMEGVVTFTDILECLVGEFDEDTLAENGGEPLPQREIARHLGISRSYVSRIEKKALEKLKEYLKDS